MWLAGRNTEFSSNIRLGPCVIRNTKVSVIRSQVCTQLMGMRPGPQPTVRITEVSVIQRSVICTFYILRLYWYKHALCMLIIHLYVILFIKQLTFFSTLYLVCTGFTVSNAVLCVFVLSSNVM